MTLDLAQRVAELEQQIARLTSSFHGGEDPAVPSEESLKASLAEAMRALAPLQALLNDDSVNDILINNPSDIFVERAGKLERVDLKFPNDAAVFSIAKAIGAHVGRPVNIQKPLLDARLPDGSRLNVIVKPLAVDGTAISIRKFAKHGITLDAMQAQGNISASLSDFLKVAARCRLNILISGGTGSGKTTLLNALSEHIDPAERIVTIEDAAELRLQQPHVVRLETRPVRTSRFEDEISVRDLMKNALRMRPDRILVGEVRGAEAFDMMQAMNTGHEGSLTTIHANHPRDALARLENMIGMANVNFSIPVMRAQIASAIHLVVHVSRMRDGIRRVAFVSEIVGMESDVVTMQDIFVYKPSGEEADGTLKGEFKWTGIMPRFVRRVGYYRQSENLSKAFGVKLPKI